MSWGYRFSIPESARAEGTDKIQPFDSRVVTTGKLIPYLERINRRPRWATARYGLTMYSGSQGRIFWNAKRESLKSNEKWHRLMRMRIVIPIDAYVESAPSKRWMVGERAWVPGLIEPGPTGGIVTITEATEHGGVPILLTQDAAMAWLDASQWDAEKCLSGDRLEYEEADVFLSAKLDTESKCKLPITKPKAA